VLLDRDAQPHSCEGYFEHAMRLCGADGAQPGWLKLAHRLANNKCTSCASITRFVAWQADGGDALQRCCSGCALPAASGEKIEAVLINELLFSSAFNTTAKYHVDATKDARRAPLVLQSVVLDAKDGDTIEVYGTVNLT